MPILNGRQRDLFQAIGDGVISANINYEYELKDAVQAHKAIESGRHLVHQFNSIGVYRLFLLIGFASSGHI